MSLSRHAGFALVALAFTGMVLSGCGFRPLYATNNDGINDVGPQALMAGVGVAPMHGRVGQLMHIELTRRLQPLGAAEQTHTLNVKLSESISRFAVERDASATRANMKLTANYSMVRGADSKTVISGAMSTVTSFNLFNSDYATMVAEKKARENAIAQLAAKIERRLAVYFNNPDTAGK